MSATPFWFGPEERRLFGWLHQPEGEAHGAVVLCNPVGYEHLLAYSTYARLAEHLALAGFIALRFDYDGTGDSAGNDYEPGRVAAWLQSTRDAVDYVAALTDGGVAMVGMRLGATLAATVAAERDDITAAVLWDPCVSGRTFVRESKMLHIVGVGVDDDPIDDGAFEAAGQVFTSDTMAALPSLSLTDIAGPIAPSVLVLVRPDRPLNSKARDRLAELNTVTWGAADGQAELLDDLTLDERVPMAAVRRITEWLSTAAGSNPVRAVPDLPSQGVLHDAEGRRVVERPMRFGPLGLFGIMTEPEHGPVSGPTIICLNYGTAHHIGPSRLWVDLARTWAPQGLRVLRLDLSGVGDSPVRPGQQPGLSNAPEAFDDVLQVLHALNPTDPHDAVLIGVCSGAYLSIDVAALHGVRGVYAINANLRYEPPDLLASNGDVNRAAPPSRGAIRRLSASGIGDRVKDHLPPIAWHALDRLHVHPTPTHAVERIVATGTDAVLGYGTDNLLTMLVERSKYSLRQLERRPNFRLEIIDGMDHLLMLRRHRQRMADVLTTHIVSKYATPVANETRPQPMIAKALDHRPVAPSSDVVDARNRATWADRSVATSYGEMTGWSDRGEPVALAAIAPLVHDQPLLDVGVGGGRTTSFLLLMSSDYVAVDYTPEMIDVFRARNPDLEAHQADARDLSIFDDDRFAFVYFSFNGIDSVDHVDRGAILTEFHRVLRPGGCVLFSTFNKTGPAYRGGPWSIRHTSGPLPYRAARFLGRVPFRIPSYVASYRNWWHNRPLHVDQGDWGMRTLGAHDYRPVVHFTTLPAQLDALRAAGFEPMTIHGDHGRPVDPNSDLSATNWFHVAARKPAATPATP